ncbi:rRNA-binding ribosome biosynthesis protein [Entomophthora muscae]|uniref:rRNA-binding ribosome biosynthesis protein n=2 Tax=Entomophthora muscae TaxID=34485 RepID=A0ACC2RFX6_9FUNG|nr:rRNA-binding ribosome biosynthesis protein [Entomophthora muscae]
MGKSRSKRGKRSLPDPEIEDQKKIPKSFVFKSGPVGLSVSLLIKDMRKVMSPNTAKRLKEKKTNKLKDFLQVAGQFRVTHFLMFTQTEVGTYLRAARIPRGPTLTFRVLNYTLRTDIRRFGKKEKYSRHDYELAPTLVLNNFGEDEQSIRLAASMFQNMFPTIDIQNTSVSDLRRVVMFNYNSETESIDFRHYRVDVKESGVSRGVKAILSSNLPALGDLKDISELVVRDALGAESDADEAFEQTFDVAPGFFGRRQKAASTRAVKLIEIGPRMELQLIKVQAELCNGEVLYHKFIKKTKEETAKQKKTLNQKKAEAEKRKRQQELNIQKKKEAAEQHRIACGAPPREATTEDSKDGENEDEGEDHEDNAIGEMEHDNDDGGMEGFNIDEDDLFDEESDKGLNSGDDSSDQDSEEDPAPAPKKKTKTG